MPELSRFYGIVVRMYYREHGIPHFHVQHGSAAAVFSVDPLALIRGTLSPRATSFVVESAGLHRAELLADWELAVQKRPLLKIAPLE